MAAIGTEPSPPGCRGSESGGEGGGTSRGQTLSSHPPSGERKAVRRYYINPAWALRIVRRLTGGSLSVRGRRGLRKQASFLVV